MATVTYRRRLPASLLLALLALLALCGMTGVEALPKLPGAKLVQRITGKGQADTVDETVLAASEVSDVRRCLVWCLPG